MDIEGIINQVYFLFSVKLKMRFLILSLFLIIDQYLVIGEVTYCYGKDKDKTQKAHFATKTSYQMVRGPDFGNQFQVGDCTAEKVWILSRHGVRWPSLKTISKLPDLETLHKQIDANIDKIKNNLCAEDIFYLRDWHRNPKMIANNSDILTLQGQEDLTSIARFYRRGVPEILAKPFDKSNKDLYLFRHTDTERTESSYKAFVKGLFDYEADKDIQLPPNEESIALLKPYEKCSQWQTQLDKVDESGSELDKFHNSDIMKEVVQNVSKRLGFEYILERSQIELIWDICRFEQAFVRKSNSAWCAAITPNEVSVLEYAEDLKYYYKSGYGSELNTRLSCSLVQDLLNHMKTTTNPKIIAYFTHSAALQLFLTALDVGKDSELLRADNYDKMKDRKWSTSKLGPFSANFAAIKYSCPKEVNNREKVLFLLNQIPIDFPGCNFGLCNLSYVLEKYNRFVGFDCNKYFCEINSGGRLQVSVILLVSLFMYLKFFY